MQDDFITSLTYKVKEEIVERYFYERRLIELQISHVHELAREVQKLEQNLHHHFARLYKLLIDDHHIIQCSEMIGLKSPPFKNKVYPGIPEYKIPFTIKLRALTGKGKFKLLLGGEYQMLYGSAEQYRAAYENLREECKAVNYNAGKFEKNYDLMIIINFLNSMDPELVMKKYFLGANFTPEEIGAAGKGLAFKKINFEGFQFTKPPEIPDLKRVRKPLAALAGTIYTAHAGKVKTLLKQR